MRPTRSFPIVVAMLVYSALASAAPPAKDANGANPTDIAASEAAGGAIIDKTRAPRGAAPASAANDMTSMEGAKRAASASATSSTRKMRPTPVAKGASSAM